MKTIKFSHLTLTTLAVLSLVACQKGQTTSSVVEKPKQKVTQQATVTETKKEDSKTEKTVQKPSETKQVAEPIQPAVTVQESKEPAQVLLEPVQSAPVQEEPVQQVAIAEQPVASGISVEDLAGTWQSGDGLTMTIFPDGTTDWGSRISSMTVGEQGIRHLETSPTTPEGQGITGLIDYYPAGSPLIFYFVDYDENGNKIVEAKDYTDSSRDRIVIGNGGYYRQRHDLENVLLEVFYR